MRINRTKMTIETGISIGLLVFLSLLGVAVFVVITCPNKRNARGLYRLANLFAKRR
jgi:hypothetical protein